MSAFYLDILKDRLYTSATHSLARRSAQTALWEILDAFTRLIAPILSFTSEEVYHAMYEGCPPETRSDSVHELLFPKPEAIPDAEYLLAEWEKLRNRARRSPEIPGGSPAKRNHRQLARGEDRDPRFR